MSEASKAAALAHAAAVHHGSGDAEAALATAEAFHQFITGGAGDVGQSNSSTAKREATKPAAPKKPAKPATKPVPPADDDVTDEEAPDTETEDGEEVTKEQVGESIEALLNANLRKEAIALLGKFGAKGLSGIKPADYAKVKAGADNLLLSA
jgi:hypothetical protein